MPARVFCALACGNGQRMAARQCSRNVWPVAGERLAAYGVPYLLLRLRMPVCSACLPRRQLYVAYAVWRNAFEAFGLYQRHGMRTGVAYGPGVKRRGNGAQRRDVRVAAAAAVGVQQQQRRQLQLAAAALRSGVLAGVLWPVAAAVQLAALLALAAALPAWPTMCAGCGGAWVGVRGPLPVTAAAATCAQNTGCYRQNWQMKRRQRRLHLARLPCHAIRPWLAAAYGATCHRRAAGGHATTAAAYAALPPLRPGSRDVTICCMRRPWPLLLLFDWPVAQKRLLCVTIVAETAVFHSFLYSPFILAMMMIPICVSDAREGNQLFRPEYIYYSPMTWWHWWWYSCVMQYWYWWWWWWWPNDTVLLTHWWYTTCLEKISVTTLIPHYIANCWQYY